MTYSIIIIGFFAYLSLQIMYRGFITRNRKIKGLCGAYKDDSLGAHYLFHLKYKNQEYFLTDIVSPDEIHQNVCDSLCLDPTKTAIIALHTPMEYNGSNIFLGNTKKGNSKFSVYEEFTLYGLKPILNTLSYLDDYELNYSLKSAWVGGNIDKDGNIFHYNHDRLPVNGYTKPNMNNGYDIIFNIMILNLPEMDLATRTILMFHNTQSYVSANFAC